MRKKITAIVAALSLLAAFAVPSIASAAPTTGAKTSVSGVIDNNGKPVKGAHVTVVCNNYSRSTKTNNAGQYSVTFAKGQCAVGDTVTVVASKGGKGGVSSGKVTADTMKLNVVIVNVALPELGLVTGAGAVLTAGAGFLVVRRKFATENV
ncbi:MAG TPA: hypothetical protein VIM53_02525 [Candidatus Saccharimonadales bacterium]